MPRGDRLLAILRQIEREQTPTTCVPCHYCGSPAWTTDHVVPRVMLEMIRTGDDEALKTQIRQRHPQLTVPACGECNVLLGTRYFQTLGKRKAWVQHRLRVRYQKFLGMPDWSLDELAALDETLRAYVLQGLEIKRHIATRVRW